jgi:hypothetical protein
MKAQTPTTQAGFSTTWSPLELQTEDEISQLVGRSIDLGTTYIEDKFDPSLGLLREAATDVTRSKWHWLFNDNALARFVLPMVGRPGLSTNLNDTLQWYETIDVSGFYHHDRNGLQEVLWGATVQWPPRAYEYVTVRTLDDGREVRYEHNYQNPENPLQGRFDDWRSYANLSVYSALNEHNAGSDGRARAQYAETLTMFDGHGFRDLAFENSGCYETFKVALVLYAGLVLGVLPSTKAEQLVEALLSRQETTSPANFRYGGFFTHFSTQGENLADTNTETTCFALLALTQYTKQARPFAHRSWLPLFLTNSP